jgi:DNA mismatch repair protein MutS
MSQAQLKTSEDFLAEGHTPMMAQYLSVKEEHPDCLLFYRMGDFYELFFDDAVTAARVLDITLTQRGKKNGDASTAIPMCGVPYHSYDPYLAKLIRAGFKVGICEQKETPDQAKERAKKEGRPASKALVRREVVRIVTQGTLTEDALLDARDNNYLASLTHMNGQYGLAWLELSTGEFNVQPLTDGNVCAAIERTSPKELLLPLSFARTDDEHPVYTQFADIVTAQSGSLFDSQNAQKRLETYFGVGTLDSFGGFSRAEIAAAGALLDYVDRTQKGQIPYISAPKHIVSDEIVDIDAATRRSLELTRTQTGERQGSLLSVIDHTITNGGARMLQRRLSAPLMHTGTIKQRHDEVETLYNDRMFNDTLRDTLKAVPDVERALARITAGRSGPRDLGMIKDGLGHSEHLSALLTEQKSAHASLGEIASTLKHSAEIQNLYDTLNQALKEDLPFLARDGGFIAEGYHSKLDEYRVMRNESRKLIAALQNKYREHTKIDALKISFNNVLGYFVEVPSKKADAIMTQPGQEQDKDNPFIHRQTMASAVRFTTGELATLERDISQAAERSLSIEAEIFEQLCRDISTLSKQIDTISHALSALDVASSLAQLAQEQNYVRPTIDESLHFDIQNGRHPVVEKALQDQGDNNFIPNNCNLNDNQSLWLLTGPNMAGKSTFLRQNALIVILAQMGSFVPADSAHIGLVDRVFSRVGASDDLASGRSTFMVEMVETAAILNQATEKSFIILDEIGRGTATFDGLSIAWACVEHLHDVNKSRAIFATHYHELTSLQNKLDKLSCHSMEVKEWKNDIIFMHSVTSGSADHSYGVHVAKLAGLPPVVLKRAKAVLEMIEAGEQSGALTKLAEDLPLFSNVLQEEQAEEPQSSELHDRMDEINPDELSPRDALDILYQLKSLT